MSPATCPTPPDFALSSGRSVTHSIEKTEKGIRLRVETIGDNPLQLSTEEWRDYKAQALNWIHSNGYILKESSILF